MRLTFVIDQEPQINAARLDPFLLLDGLIADLKPWASCGGHGTVSGMSNFAPLACVRLWELCSKTGLSKEENEEMSQLQNALSLADVKAVPAGVRGMSKCLRWRQHVDLLMTLRICFEQAVRLRKMPEETTSSTG